VGEKIDKKMWGKDRGGGEKKGMTRGGKGRKGVWGGTKRKTKMNYSWVGNPQTVGVTERRTKKGSPPLGVYTSPINKEETHSWTCGSGERRCFVIVEGEGTVWIFLPGW